MTVVPIKIQRGDVWDVQFSPQVGSELDQKHPAVVMNCVIHKHRFNQ
jgi:mRNA-degrading endonuclease toxin of MazEF toxin-antitoxin module